MSVCDREDWNLCIYAVVGAGAELDVNRCANQPFTRFATVDHALFCPNDLRDTSGYYPSVDDMDSLDWISDLPSLALRRKK